MYPPDSLSSVRSGDLDSKNRCSLYLIFFYRIQYHSIPFPSLTHDCNTKIHSHYLLYFTSGIIFHAKHSCSRIPYSLPFSVLMKNISGTTGAKPELWYLLQHVFYMRQLWAGFLSVVRNQEKEIGRNYMSLSPPEFQLNYSAVVGSIIVTTSLTEFAGKPPCFACSRTISSFGAM